MAESVGHDGSGNGAGGPEDEHGEPFPSYEELASDLLEALDEAGLSIEDVRHELEPGTGERRFECTIRLSPGEPPSRYHAHLSYTWDALMTYVAAYGPGADCDLYHDEDEAPQCPHRHLEPQPFVEIEAEFVLGDGGYELQDVGEVTGWVQTVQGLLGKVFAEDDKPSVHVGLAALGTSVLVEKLTAEHSWVLDFSDEPDLASVAKSVQQTLKVIPQLADRLPI